jgi:hypothetical protein
MVLWKEVGGRLTVVPGWSPWRCVVHVIDCELKPQPVKAGYIGRQPGWTFEGL